MNDFVPPAVRAQVAEAEARCARDRETAMDQLQKKWGKVEAELDEGVLSKPELEVLIAGNGRDEPGIRKLIESNQVEIGVDFKIGSRMFEVPEIRRHPLTPKIFEFLSQLQGRIRDVLKETSPQEKPIRKTSAKLRKQRVRAGRGNRKVQDESDRKSIAAAFKKFRRSGYDTDNGAAKRVVELAEDFEKYKYIDLLQPYPDLNADNVKRIAGVKK